MKWIQANNRRIWIAILGPAALVVLAAVGVRVTGEGLGLTRNLNGERAFQDAKTQMSFGPRTPDSQAHAQMVDWLKQTLREAGWQVEVQESEVGGHTIQNVVARRPESGGTPESKPWIILGAHYDSRLRADRDPDPLKQNTPVPGANDGASGVAVLTELARDLPRDLNKDVWLVFFDAEDNANIPGWSGLLGSQAFVDSLSRKPQSVVVVDMIGDADLNIYPEMNSNPVLNTSIWATAARLGYSNYFIPVPKHSILDDHTPFLQAGIQAADLIDFDYPYWHTSADTLDKISAHSLQVVGETLLAWLKQ